MKNVCSILIFSFLSALTFSQTTLQYNLKVGDVFTVKQNARQVITQELDGAFHEITNTIYGLLEFRVVGKKADTFELTITFKDLTFNVNSSIQGELLNVNALDSEADDSQSKMFHSLLDVPVHLVLARNGDILEVTGGDILVSKMAESSGLQDPFSLNLMKKSLEREFGSAALSESYKQLTYIYPTKKINIGDSWQNEYTGKLSAKNTWTLKGLTTSNANITGKAVVAMDVTEPATTMKLNGTQMTAIITNLTTGFIQKMTVEGVSDGYSTMTQMGGQEIPTTIKSTVTYELIQ